MASTQPAAAVRSRSRFALPVLRTHTVGLLLVPFAAVAVALAQPADFDYWWHRRTGEYIVRNLSVPRSDIFSFTAQGQPWTDHEWLSQVLIYLGGEAFGYIGLFLLFMALGVGAWWLTYRLLQREGLGELQALGLSIAVAAFGATYWRVRPAMFTVFVLPYFHAHMYAARRGERQRLWHLAPLMVLWANLHGGYVIGLVLLALLAASQWWDRRTTAGPSWQHVAIVLAIAFLAAGLNPNTYKLWEYPLTYLGGGNASLAQIDEWQSPNFHQLRNAPLALLLLSGLVAGANARRFDIWRTLLMLVFGAMSLHAMRHQPLFAIVWAAVIGPSLLERWPWWGKTTARRGGVSSINYALLAAGMAALVTVLAVSPHGIPVWSAPTGGAISQPVAGAAYIDQHYPGARIFNEYEWGGYLIDRLYPRELVFIDGRADLYGPLVVEYGSLVKGGGDWQATFDRYSVDVALLSPRLPIVKQLKQSGWSVGYEDADQVVLAKP